MEKRPAIKLTKTLKKKMFIINVISTVRHETIKPYVVSIIIIKMTATEETKKNETVKFIELPNTWICMNHEPEPKYMTNNRNVPYACVVFFPIKFCPILISHITL